MTGIIRQEYAVIIQFARDLDVIVEVRKWLEKALHGKIERIVGFVVIGSVIGGRELAGTVVLEDSREITAAELLRYLDTTGEKFEIVSCEKNTVG